MRQRYTLSFMIDNNKILLGMKKRGFGAGRWNGFGGKVHDGETIEQAAKRELAEEIGVRAKSLQKHGIIDFSFEGKPGTLEVHIFVVTAFSGEPVEGEEMAPRWFSSNKIPYKKMWVDDPHWLPLLISGKRFRGKFHFSADEKKVLSHELNEVREF